MPIIPPTTHLQPHEGHLDICLLFFPHNKSEVISNVRIIVLSVVGWVWMFYSHCSYFHRDVQTLISPLLPFPRKLADLQDVGT